MATRTLPREVWQVHPMIQPTRTIARPGSLNRRGPLEAAFAVGEFIGAPTANGCWELERFEIDWDGVMFDYMRAHGDGKGRWSCGIGTFIKLLRVGGEDGREIVMSNTPQEMKDHQDALDNAFGKVLVHGLGLSCVVSGLLAKPEVHHIDVVEIDADLIELVGPAYEREGRVTIHQGDCLTYDWPKGKRWNYVWHDIWTDIRESNISNPEEAEFGITYEMLHRKFGGRCDYQASWGFKEAHGLRRSHAARDRKKEKFRTDWRKASFEERVTMLVKFHHDSQMHVPDIMPRMSMEEWRENLTKLGMMKAIEQAAREDEAPGVWFDW
jgi:hypothetical protein